MLNYNDLDIGQHYDVRHHKEKAEIDYYKDVEYCGTSEKDGIVYLTFKSRWLDLHEIPVVDIDDIEVHKEPWEKDVIYVKYHSNNIIYRGTLSKQSKTTFTVIINVDERPIPITFNKSNLDERGASVYTASSIISYMSPEDIAEYNAKQRISIKRHNIEYYIRTSIMFSEVSDKDMIAVWDILKKYKKDK